MLPVTLTKIDFDPKIGYAIFTFTISEFGVIGVGMDCTPDTISEVMPKVHADLIRTLEAGLAGARKLAAG